MPCYEVVLDRLFENVGDWIAVAVRDDVHDHDEEDVASQLADDGPESYATLYTRMELGNSGISLPHLHLLLPGNPDEL